MSKDLSNKGKEKLKKKKRIKSTQNIKDPSSRYDLIKIRVRLMDHYYVLSRFLVSQMLMVTKVPHQDSIHIALTLKKNLVDKGCLDITQEELMVHLFQTMEEHGYSGIYRKIYEMMFRLHNKRVPVIILISGTKHIGKSTLAVQLSERLNLGNILQTDIVSSLMCSYISTFYSQKQIWFRKYENDQDFLAHYQEECEIVRNGVHADISKSLREGKSVIIEGSHIDLGLYQDIIESHNLAFFQRENNGNTNNTNNTNNGNTIKETVIKNDSNNIPNDPKNSNQNSNNNNNNSNNNNSESNKIQNDKEISQNLQNLQNPIKNGNKPNTPNLETLPSGRMGLIVPIFLTLDEKNHTSFIENFISCLERSSDLLDDLGEDTETQTATLLSRFRLQQSYLHERIPLTTNVIEVNPFDMESTLEKMHNSVIERIEWASNNGRF
ncbi:p-loop containing nucleoside triphosphate hydrolases superfamily protein [Anaeramoeba ignava]|uniref:P-loop containing nucleoside triphosphate hydrolases superfamily protein n=1 Tax=Anaeramoeba ignava TaxID=1746090 RepID=A0A9Q0R6D9_ANAIG|nr:p-loop containing nucleoside triphosphate hydrolases superfamily protein [Anaeramoeba ignava]